MRRSIRFLALSALLATASLGTPNAGYATLHAQEAGGGVLAVRLDEARLALRAEIESEERREAARVEEAARFRTEEAKLLAELGRLPDEAGAPVRALLAELRNVERRQIEEREMGRIASQARLAELEAAVALLEARISRGEDAVPATRNARGLGPLAWAALALGAAGFAAGLVALRKHNIGTERRADTADALARPSAVPVGDEGGASWDGTVPAWDEGRVEAEFALLDPERRAAFEALLAACEKRGAEVDAVTRRPGASYLVAALSHAIAAELGLDPEDRLLHRCAGLVYDSGFLDTDPAVFESSRLSDAQFAEIRRHPEAGSRMLDFVPEAFRPPLSDASLCHHENLDGSGYPRALRGATIPRIARVIRAAESFTALVSSRPWRRTRDRETAIDELVHRPDVYDREIVRALESAVSRP
jgi:HD-GYP domain-containing protein (c-di-GMP phosphodiesterase class II)